MIKPGELKVTFIGTYWAHGGTLFHLSHANGNEARVYVDDVGETWVDIRRIPEGGIFHSERVEAWQAYNGAADAERVLREQGFDTKRIAYEAHRVRERD